MDVPRLLTLKNAYLLPQMKAHNTVMRVLIMLFFLHLTCSGFGQVIQGRVVDSTTDQPVPFASVGVVDTWQGTSTNLEGEFSLKVYEAARIKITCIGYESATFTAAELPAIVKLKPTPTVLNEIVVLSKAPNPRVIVRRAFANESRNFSRQSFLQTFFYRHYCRDDSVYGRLIEASVEVWKQNGYRLTRATAGEREDIRITHLRRSLDNTAMAQGHEPIAIGDVLEADMAAYQTSEKSPYPRFYDHASNLKTDFENYDFTLDGVSVYDGHQAYLIRYASKKDSILTTRGYLPAPSATGTLIITLEDFAFIKTEDLRKDGDQWLKTSAFYQKQGAYYFPYHFVREGESKLPGNHLHSFHIELMAVDIQHSLPPGFTATPMDRQGLSKIPYDSSFWSTSTILKTTPLENEIIHDLGGGKSLNNQFHRYRQHEWATSYGGSDATEKFEWLRKDNIKRHPMLLSFLPSNCRPFIPQLEALKRLNQDYRESVAFVIFVIDPDETNWQQTNAEMNLFADGIVSYRIADPSPLLKQYQIEKVPRFILLARDGAIFSSDAKWPDNELLKDDLRLLTSNTKP